MSTAKRFDIQKMNGKSKKEELSQQYVIDFRSCSVEKVLLGCRSESLQVMLFGCSAVMIPKSSQKLLAKKHHRSCMISKQNDFHFFHSLKVRVQPLRVVMRKSRTRLSLSLRMFQAKK